MKTTHYFIGLLISVATGAIALISIVVLMGGYPDLNTLGPGVGVGLFCGLSTMAFAVPTARKALKKEAFVFQIETSAESIVKSQHRVSIRMGLKTEKGDWKILINNLNMNRVEFFRVWDEKPFTNSIGKEAVTLVYNEKGEIIVRN